MSFTQNGRLSFAYAIAFSSGKPSLKKLIKKSQTGQFSTSSSRMILSPKMTTSKSFSLPTSLFKILREGLLRALESRAQMPMVPILFGFRSPAVERSVDADALFGLLVETRRDAPGVRPRFDRASL